MVREARFIDLNQVHLPELARLAQEVRRTGITIVLRENGEDIAEVSPAKPKRRLKGKRVTEDDIAASLSAAGSWKGLVDTEQLKRELDEARGDTSPPVRP